ncbi:hypothetical protein AMTR_s00102p00053770 [Amborella trichopoda]|uniref:Uncharacterized protein n=1 Tax=Amborella trichopoda TaxID=13333 RepID=W1NYY2_AMBTC|nr:hypothetical protein AMTR_s00102p00053770 [Amborella trichopoda]
MAKIKSTTAEAYDRIMVQHSNYWANTYFKRCRYNHLISNISESFNQWILQAREKPLIKLLECVRVPCPKNGAALLHRRPKRAYSLLFNPLPDVLKLSEIVYTTVMPPAARQTASRPKNRRMQIEYKEIRPLKCS